ncbi:MAG: 50S ribosomal protein L15 [Candidatus Lindowbacteria bacterium RIFCSPLOWO2_12_FULL_62_27]|nr:ribosomal protein L15 [uncultured bacterium]OGH59725.1 MAG: 50S ribosomal protein L15 [Candidatus Lindowbacteria bacterium RIFCSPLOWO2_12_FULL_62_27]OGH63575.1 MAG: 50S ribosomal protein L15 [Candidatus Lindowbacteria bacterium RIFCSPLOWO2_02_FULL_62_12]
MSLELSALPKIVGRRQRLGRGEGSGRGKTSGRGHKGQKARSKVRRGFEGGQMPLFRRLPKGGFKRSWRVVASIVNLEALNRFADGDEVTVEKLKESGLVRSKAALIKVLAGGKLTRKLKVVAHRFSAGARSAIESAGGSVQIAQ